MRPLTILNMSGPSLVNIDSLDPDDSIYDEIKDPPIFSEAVKAANPVWSHFHLSFRSQQSTPYLSNSFDRLRLVLYW